VASQEEEIVKGTVDVDNLFYPVGTSYVENGTEKVGCTVTMLSCKTALTASHCVDIALHDRPKSDDPVVETMTEGSWGYITVLGPDGIEQIGWLSGRVIRSIHSRVTKANTSDIALVEVLTAPKKRNHTHQTSQVRIC